MGPFLANASKRYKLYHKFWSLLAKLGVWDEPIYVALKESFTSNNDRREVMPVCILDVSYLLIISLTNNLYVLGGEKGDTQIHSASYTPTFSHPKNEKNN